jgi:alginate O-acetyltransferase complex protein AlgI
MVVILVSLVLFNGIGMAGAFSDVAGLFGGAGMGFIGPESLYYLRSFAWLFAIAIFASTPLLKRAGDKLLERKSRLAWLEPAIIAVILALVTAHLVDGSFNPFIYFWF